MGSSGLRVVHPETRVIQDKPWTRVEQTHNGDRAITPNVAAKVPPGNDLQASELG
jgi:hypothetical protein